MGKITLTGFKTRLAKILAAQQTTNLDIHSIQLGTGNSTAEDPSNTALDAATGPNRVADVQSFVSNQAVISVFYVAGTFGAVTIKEVGAFFADGVLAIRDTTNGTLPIANANTVDIRIDATILIDQG